MGVPGLLCLGIEKSLLSSCARAVYAIRTLKTHGLPTQAIHEVARATVLARLL